LELGLDKQESILTELGIDINDLPAIPMSLARLSRLVEHELERNDLADKFCVLIEQQHLKSCAEEHRKEMQ
jgi:hypothetical protein